MKITTWTIEQGDWIRPSGSDYDKEIQEMRRAKRKVQKRTSITFLLVACMMMLSVLYLIKSI